MDLAIGAAIPIISPLRDTPASGFRAGRSQESTMSQPSLDTAAAMLDPLDVLEQVAAVRDWPYDRAEDGDFAIFVSGRWADYHLTFSWREDMRALHFVCALDLRVPPRKRRATYALVGMLNERLWLGHFELASEDGMVMFRHAMPLGGASLAPGQCEDLIDLAVDACERFYPAFQFVVWAGKSPEEAVEAAMFETRGEA
jgi:hypothetical protein